MLLDADDSQLVLVDYQARLMPAIFENQIVIANAVRLVRMAKLLEVPVWGTAQNLEKLGPNVTEIQAEIEAAGGRTLAKMCFSAVADGLGDWLRPPVQKQISRPSQGNARSLPKHLQKIAPEAQEGRSRSSIVIAGCEAHVCLLQTALDLLQEDFEVWVVTDACSSRSERNRDAAFDRLAGNGAELVTTEMVAFEWLGSAEHPVFKDVLGLVK